MSRFLRVLTSTTCLPRAGLSSPQVKSSLPDIQPWNGSYVDFLFKDYDRFKDKVVLVDALSQRKYTMGLLKEGTHRVSSSLTRLPHPVLPGDRICTYLPNCAEYLIAVLGVLSAGAVTTMANPTYTSDELTYQLKHSKSTKLITISMLLRSAGKAAKRAGCVNEIFLLDKGKAGAKELGCSSFMELLEDDGTADRREDTRGGSAMALIPYSSGTTGLPKGVMLSHRNIATNILQVTAMNPLYPHETIMGLLPFFHIFGLVPVLGCGVSRGLTNIIQPRFNAELFLSSIQEHKISTMHLVPPIILFLLQHPLVQKFDLSSVERICSAAAPLSQQAMAAFRQKYPHIDLFQGFGMTELSPVTTVMPAEKDRRHGDKHGKGCVGMAVPNTVHKVVDVDTGEELAAYQEGEIAVRGTHVMMGYLDNPQATADCIKDGWLHTGDIGYYDNDGYFYIVDRLKDLIKVKGLQVAPAEVEHELVSHPAVADATVFSVPDDRSGELPAAFVVLKPGTDKTQVTAQVLKDHVAPHLAPYKHLRGGVFFANELPRNASGKILRRELQRMIPASKK